MSTKVSKAFRRDESVNCRRQELAESCATGINGKTRKDAIDELERLVGCRSPEQGLENVREDAGGRLVALLRSEVFCADPLGLSGHELGHVVAEGSAVVVGGASDSGEVASDFRFSS